MANSILPSCKARHFVLEPVPMPDVRSGDDVIIEFMRDEAAFLEANDSIGAGPQCLRDQRQIYKEKASP